MTVHLPPSQSGALLDPFCRPPGHSFDKKRTAVHPAPRNFGLEHATAGYVLLVDSDDILLPTAITTLVGAMSQQRRKLGRRLVELFGW